jgi:hypothetical protein
MRKEELWKHRSGIEGKNKNWESYERKVTIKASIRNLGKWIMKWEAKKEEKLLKDQYRTEEKTLRIESVLIKNSY